MNEITENTKLEQKQEIAVKFNALSTNKLLFSSNKYIVAPKMTGILKRLEYFTVKFLLKPIALTIIFAPAHLSVSKQSIEQSL